MEKQTIIDRLQKSAGIFPVDAKIIDGLETEIKKLPIMLDVVKKIKLLGGDIGGIEEDIEVIAKSANNMIEKLKKLREKNEKSTETEKKVKNARPK